MANAQWTYPHSRQMSLALSERVPGGRGIWLIGRLVLGGLFLVSGTQKLMGLDGFAATLVKGGIPETIAPLLAPIAAIAETLGGLLIVVGFATNAGALLLALFTLIAAFVSHRFWEFQGDMMQLQMAHFLKNMMLVGAFMMLYVAGGGPCSIDRWQRERGEPEIMGR